MKNLEFSKSFTLIELLVVLALIAILATVLIVVIQPTKIFQNARDTQRISDLKKIEDLINLMYAQDLTFSELKYASPNIVYLSLKDSNPNCGSYSLPPLPPGWSYRCSDTPTNMDGTGWIPIPFSQNPFIGLANLPIDPINKPPYYYSFVVGGSYKLTAKPERNYQPAITDGGIEPILYEIGTNLKLSTFQSGLVGYWPLDESPAYHNSTIKDLSGYGNNGTLFASPTDPNNKSTSGKVGGALSFDGVDDYVYVPGTQSLLNGTTKATIVVWVRTLGTSGSHRHIAGWRDESDTDFHIVHLANSNNLELRIRTTTGIWDLYPSFGNYYNSWTQIAFIRNENIAKAYLNGIETGSSENITGAWGISNNLTLGAHPLNFFHFDGSLDEVRIYNRALSADEIKALYEATK